MGNKIFTHLSAWSEDPLYIVDITTSTIGRQVLAMFGLSGLAQNGNNFWRELSPRVETQVEKISNETLGRIMGYGSFLGLHANASASAVSFLNMTGWADLMDNPHLRAHGRDGRETLEHFAALTLVSIARDIILQERWQAEMRARLAAEEEFDRGMKGYVHGRPSAK